MRYIDTHCHLNSEKMFDKWEEYLQRFVDVGGVGIINAGASEAYNRNAIVIAESIKHKAESYKNIVIKSNLARHPLEVVEGYITKDNINERMDRLKSLIKENKQYVVGIGECGIDLHYANTPEILDLQKKLFVEHCKLARELDLPLVVHSRDAFDQTMDVLKDFTDLVVYFHCRGYGPEEIKRLTNSQINRLFVGFCGNVTYKKADNLLESLKLVPLDQLVLETDAPYLTPQAVRGQVNEPMFVQYVYDFVSNFLNIELEKLGEIVEKNFKELIGYSK